MYVINRILVPADFSRCSLAALDYAVAMADRLVAEVDVLHVWEAPPRLRGDGGLLDAFVATHAGEEMRRYLARYEGRTRASIHGRLETGDPCDTILDVAEREGYDLIVMGTRGRTGISHALLGSVAEKVIRRAPCPVVTIRTPEQEEARYRRPPTRYTDSRPSGEETVS
jgi:nucleotide-binding universal stress UspA family protein